MNYAEGLHVDVFHLSTVLICMLVICLDIPATTIPSLVATVDFTTTTIPQQDLNSTPLLTTVLVVITTALTLLLIAIIVIAIARKCKKRMKKTDARVVEEVEEDYYCTIPDLHPNPVAKNTRDHAQDSPPELYATCTASNDGGENMDVIKNEAYLTRREAGLEIQCNTAM